MEGYEIAIKGKDGFCRAKKQSDEEVIFVYKEVYEQGDKISFKVPEVPGFYIIRIDDCMDEAMVYLTNEEIEFVIPFEEKKISYNPKAFSGDCHYMTLRKAEKWEYESYRNLTKNVIDQHEIEGCYPHAYANVETRGEAVFAARNAIDGILANEYHGAWPYESWGINRQDDAEITVDFGRAVDIEQIVLYTRADFPHDNWWEQVTFLFSDGSSEVVQMEKSEKPKKFAITKNQITWVKMKDMKKGNDPSPFPALSQIEVYGV